MIYRTTQLLAMHQKLGISIKIDVKTEIENVNWSLISETLKSVGIAHYSPDKHKKAFEASYSTVFLYDQEKMVGFGSAISDGSYQAAIYDCAVIKKYQGKGLGKKIVQEILLHLKDCNIILYTSPGKEGFYEKLDFKKMHSQSLQRTTSGEPLVPSASFSGP